MSRFIKYIPDSEISKFLEKKPLTNHLALIIAKRARRSIGANGLQIGECIISDYGAYGLTEQQYRTAKKHLEKLNFCTFRITDKVTLRITDKVTSKVTDKVTVAKLVSISVWDINENDTNGQGNGQSNGLDNGQGNDKLTMFNKNDNKNEEEEKYIYLAEFQKIAKGEIIRTTQLDNNFHFGLFKKEWTENFQNEILKFWRYAENKKGDNWGTIGTLSGQLDAIKSYLNHFSELDIIKAFNFTRSNGNISWNPEWAKKATEKADKDKPTFKDPPKSTRATDYRLGQKYNGT